MRVPRALYLPPKKKKNRPMSNMIPVNFIIFFNGISLSSVLINCDTKTELKKMATNNDEPKTIDSVMGKITIN